MGGWVDLPVASVTAAGGRDERRIRQADREDLVGYLIQEILAFGLVLFEGGWMSGLLGWRRTRWFE